MTFIFLSRWVSLMKSGWELNLFLVFFVLDFELRRLERNVMWSKQHNISMISVPEQKVIAYFHGLYRIYSMVYTIFNCIVYFMLSNIHRRLLSTTSPFHFIQIIFTCEICYTIKKSTLYENFLTCKSTFMWIDKLVDCRQIRSHTNFHFLYVPTNENSLKCLLKRKAAFVTNGFFL